MSETKLRSELDDVVEELNGCSFRDDDCFQYEIGSHHHGIAVDITKDGEAPHKVLGQFSKAIMRAGYVVTATNVAEDYYNGDHTRIFLGDASEYFNLEQPTFVAAPFGERSTDYEDYVAKKTNHDQVYGTVADGMAVAFAVEGSWGEKYLNNRFSVYTITPTNGKSNEYDDCLKEYRSKTQ
jgi:hypothetical protein